MNKLLLKIIIMMTIITTTLSNTSFIPVNLTNFIISMTILVAFIFFLIEGIKKVYIIIFIVTIFPIILNFSPNLISLSNTVMIYLMIKNLKKSDLKHICKFSFLLQCSSNICVWSLFLIKDLNIDKNITMWRIDGIIYRSSLGYSHPNIAMMVMIPVALLAPYVLSKHYIFKLVVLLIISFCIYNYTLSRTSFFIIAAYLIAHIILKKKYLNEKTMDRNLIFMPLIVSLLISLALLFMPINNNINDLLSGRQILYQNFYDYNGGIKFLGNKQLESNMFDNGYLQALLSKGMIFFIILICVFFIILKENSKYITFGTLFLVTAFFSLAITETTFFRFEILIPFLLSLVYENSFIEKVSPYK